MSRKKEEKIYSPEDLYSTSVNVRYKFWKAFKLQSAKSGMSYQHLMEAMMEAHVAPDLMKMAEEPDTREIESAKTDENSGDQWKPPHARRGHG